MVSTKSSLNLIFNKYSSKNEDHQLQFFNKWSLEDILKIKFKNHTRPELGTYVVIYTKLAKRCINDKVLKDILLIGLNIKDKFGNFIFNFGVNGNVNGKYNAIPNFVIDFPKYSIDAVCNYARTENSNVPIPPSDEEDFKTYMEILCSIFIRLIYKKSISLKSKTESICLGASILGKKYKGLNRYLNITDDLIKDFRSYANDCIWKENIAVLLIKTFAKYK